MAAEQENKQTTILTIAFDNNDEVKIGIIAGTGTQVTSKFVLDLLRLACDTVVAQEREQYAKLYAQEALKQQTGPKEA